jgi:hypothetical protein
MLARIGPFLLINAGLVMIVSVAKFADQNSNRRRRFPFIVGILPPVLIAEVIAVSTLTSR